MTTTKRVCVLLGSLAIGGAEKQVVEILRRLDRTRFLPHLYLIYGQGELLSEVPPDVPIVSYWSQHRPPRLYFPGRVLWHQARHLRKMLRLWRIDILYDRTSQMSLTSYLAGRPHRMVRVSVAAGDPVRQFQKAHQRFGRLKYWVLRRAYRDADQVIAVSEAVRQELIRFFGLAPEQVETHDNLFDLAQIQRLSGAHDVPRQTGMIHVVSVGRLESEKGHHVLIQAMDRLVHSPEPLPVRLWLIGRGPEESHLRRLVESRRLQHVVEFLGFQSNPFPWVRCADVFCLPSLYEGMPNALVEAMLLGTPVVASDCPGGVRELLADGRWGQLAVPGDPQSLADQLAWVLRHLTEARQRAENARRWVSARFDAPVVMDRLQRLFEELLDRRSTHRLPADEPTEHAKDGQEP